ncbi:MAG TPA: copper resistance CopC family protein [Candidatus Acidoferrales bacterium]|nr:copper resistance CopC family protein [Candidatus Acidoferrales bacterium]
MHTWRFGTSIVLALAMLLPRGADGHAIVLSAVPALHDVVRGPDVPIKLRFNSKIDTKRSRLTLVAPDGSQIALAIAEAPSGDTLVSEAKGLKAGAYVLRWQVLASDGHITRGEVPFRVQ